MSRATARIPKEVLRVGMKLYFRPEFVENRMGIKRGLYKGQWHNLSEMVLTIDRIFNQCDDPLRFTVSVRELDGHWTEKALQIMPFKPLPEELFNV